MGVLGQILALLGFQLIARFRPYAHLQVTVNNLESKLGHAASYCERDEL